METLYYTVDKSDIDLYGTRTIRVYRIENNRLILVAELTCVQDAMGYNMYSDEEEIQMFLDEDGVDSECEFNQIL